MSQTTPKGAGNGFGAAPIQAALIIDADIERHILLRRAIRKTDLFSLILSAESAATGQEILNDPGTPHLSLILIERRLAGPVLARMSETQMSRSALISEQDTPANGRPVLVVPAEPEDIVDLLEKLD